MAEGSRLAIELVGVTKRFGSVAAVEEASLAVEAGEICVLIGPSGCGKTTTLKMINRVIEPSAGTIRVRGRNVTASDPVELRRSIGYVIQHVGLFPHMTIGENVAIPLRLRGVGRRVRRERAAELLDLVGLTPDMLDRRPSELSGGQQQRAGVARALAGDPDIVLMDEPFGAVDPLLRTQLQRELHRIQRRVRKTIVLVTHDLSEAFALADRLVLMRQGRIVQQGAPRDLVLSPADDFVRRFLLDVRATDILEVMRLDDLPRSPGIGCEGLSLAATTTLRQVITALAQAARGDRRMLQRITLLDSGGQAAGWVAVADVVRAVGETLRRGEAP